MPELKSVQTPSTRGQYMPEGGDGLAPRHGTLGVDLLVPPRQLIKVKIVKKVIDCDVSPVAMFSSKCALRLFL